jgi:phage shock protein A
VNKKKAEKLNAAGWQTGNAEDFLNLSPREQAAVFIREEIERVEGQIKFHQSSIKDAQARAKRLKAVLDQLQTSEVRDGGDSK